MRTISRTVLEAQGIACDEVGDGRAVEAARGRHYDLLLIDVEMPGMPGTEVLRQLRDDLPSANLKVIMTSGRVSTDDMSSMILSGADDFLAKPFSVVQLIARTKAAIRLKTAQDRSDNLNRQVLAANQKLESSLASKEGDLVYTRNTLVLTLAELIAIRAAETAGHLKRIAGYVRAFAQELLTVPGFASLVDENFILSFEGAAPLHDIGMIGVPEHILLKPGKLDAEESLVMQSHTTQGAEILQKLASRNGIAAGFLQTAIDITRHHHERWDGRGYPDRLAGSDIPLFGPDRRAGRCVRRHPGQTAPQAGAAAHRCRADDDRSVAGAVRPGPFADVREDASALREGFPSVPRLNRLVTARTVVFLAFMLSSTVTKRLNQLAEWVGWPVRTVRRRLVYGRFRTGQGQDTIPKIKSYPTPPADSDSAVLPKSNTLPVSTVND